MPLKALVVEDNKADFDLIRVWAEQGLGDSLTLEHATTVEAAADLMSGTVYDLIIHDLFLPPHGPEAITEAFRKAPGVPIVAMTGQSSPDLHRTAISNGATIFCSKFDPGSDRIASILAEIFPDIGSS